jgi:hypothetical protein
MTAAFYKKENSPLNDKPHQINKAMKRSILSIMAVAALGITGANAQSAITLNTTDLAYIGKVVKQASDTMPGSSIVPGPAGTNQTWNFSALMQHSVDTLTFTNPNWRNRCSGRQLWRVFVHQQLRYKRNRAGVLW